MRTFLRAGAIALAASSVLLGGAVAAQAAPAGAIDVTVSRLVLEPGDLGHAGTARVVLKNRAAQAAGGSFTVTEPFIGALDTVTGADGCWSDTAADGRRVLTCDELPGGPLAAGERRQVTMTFRALARPQAFPQVAANGVVAVAGTPVEFATLFRSTTGSLRKPRPYVQDTRSDLVVTAEDATLTGWDEDTLAGSVQVTVRSQSDAPHRELWTEITLPARFDFTGIEPSEVCVGAGTLPPPPGGTAWGCSVPGGAFAEGEERTFRLAFTVPADVPVGPVGDGQVLVELGNGRENVEPARNVDAYSVSRDG